MSELEKTDLSLGIIPLTDCAPIVIAYEKGYFTKYGLDVTISAEASWSSIRDKVAFNVLDGAQMLAPMPIAMTLGLFGFQKPMVTGLSLDLNGNGITVSSALHERMCEADPNAMETRPMTARALKKVIDLDRAAGRPPMRFATVFPFSSHYYQLCYWMAEAGIDPHRDVELVIVPPPQMVEQLAQKQIMGYCVGEPWNQQSVAMGIGRTLITSYEIWNNGPEKVFGVTRDWADRHPNTHRAILMALIEAARWLDADENRAEAVRLISDRRYVNAPPEVIERTMLGRYQYDYEDAEVDLPDFNVFHRYAATFPWRSHAVWIISQMMRWGQIDRPIDIEQTVASVYLPDVYRDACRQLGLPYPLVNAKIEGKNDEPWMLESSAEPITMGPDRFFDGRIFDPAALDVYIDQPTANSPSPR